MFGKAYKRLLSHGKYIDLPEYAIDHLIFGHETRLGILEREIFFLKKEIKRIEAYLVPFLQEIIQEKEQRFAKIRKERS
jgi:hypothetical protein